MRNELSALPDSAIATLATELRPIAPPSGLKARVLARLRTPAFVTVPPEAGDWRRTAAGVEMKILHNHGDAQSFMLRLAPGARIAQHAHQSDELCVVLEGSVRLGDIEAGPGTYHLALAGSEHREIWTETGCVLFLRADLDRGIRF